MALTRPENVKIERLPFVGPCAVVGSMLSLRAPGQSLTLRHHEWAGKSRVNVNGAAPREHFFLSEVLCWQVQFDRLDALMLASTEPMYRRLVQTEAAVRRPPLPHTPGARLLGP